MAFIYEIIPEKDIDFFKSLGIRDWSGTSTKHLSPGETRWCIDRERNVFLITLGGGCYDGRPYYHALWWDGSEIRISEDLEIVKNEDGAFVRKLIDIVAPQKAYDKKDEMCKLIVEVFDARNKQINFLSVTEICCEPKLEKKRV